MGGISDVPERKMTKLMIKSKATGPKRKSELSSLRKKKTYPMFHRAYFYKCRYHIYGGEKREMKFVI